MAPTLLSPPPGVTTRALEGEKATLERLLRHAPEGSDDLIDPAFFDVLRDHVVVEHTWDGCEHTPKLFPLVTTNASMLGATFSVPLDQATALLPATERLTPARRTRDRAAAFFFATRYRRGGLGAHHECGVAIPVLLDAPHTPPLLPVLGRRRRTARHPALGLYVVEMPVDDPSVEEAGRRLYGRPKSLATATLELDERGGDAALDMDDERVAELAVRLRRPPRARRHDLSFQTFSLLEGRIVRSRCSAIGEGYVGGAATAELSVGDRRRAQRLGRLRLGRLIEARVLPRLNWIAWAPEDVGGV